MNITAICMCSLSALLMSFAAALLYHQPYTAWAGFVVLCSLVMAVLGVRRVLRPADRRRWWDRALVWGTMAALLLPATLLLASPPAATAPDTLTASEATPAIAATAPKTAVLGSYKARLTTGHYTAGVDFPAGSYTITAVSGYGNVFAANTAATILNEIMGVSPDDFYVRDYEGASLRTGVVLTVVGLTVEISSGAADIFGVIPRENTATEVVELGPGNHYAGEDFPPGTYDISLLSGVGNIYTDLAIHDGGLNAIFGADDPRHEQRCRNVTLPEYGRLSVSGDLLVRLSPSA